MKHNPGIIALVAASAVVAALFTYQHPEGRRPTLTQNGNVTVSSQITPQSPPFIVRAQKAETTITSDHPSLDKEQNRVAGKVLTAAHRSGAPEWAQVATIMCALVESQLRNLPFGHGSSVGVFQQIAEWGSYEERINVEWSTNAFLGTNPDVPNAGLLDIPRSNDLGSMIQEVQRSAYPTRYAQAESLAREVVNHSTLS